MGKLIREESWGSEWGSKDDMHEVMVEDLTVGGF